MPRRTLVIYGKKPLESRPPQESYPDATFWGMGRGHADHWNGNWRWDAWFEMHPIDQTPYHGGIIKTRPMAWRAMQKLPGVGEPGHRPVYMLQVDPRVPASVQFPYERVDAAFPPEPGEPHRWQTCMMDDILPYAYLEGFEHVVIMGHGVSRDPLHMLAHVGILYWIARLRGLGVQVDVTEPSWYRAPATRYCIDAGAFRPSRDNPVIYPTTRRSSYKPKNRPRRLSGPRHA